MAENFIQKVGDKVYNAQYEISGDTLAVTCNGQRKEEKLEFLKKEPLYKARDILRELVRDSEKAAA